VGARGRAAGLALVVAGAVLLALGGPARGGDDRGETAATPAATAARSASDPGRVLFVRMGCGSCHRLAAGSGIGQIGPDLDTLLPNYDAASLRAKIVDPYPAGASQSYVSMPENFGTKMNARELDALVAFLLGTVRR
jgi:mono/diheme cytochrome c family protein